VALTQAVLRVPVGWLRILRIARLRQRMQQHEPAHHGQLPNSSFPQFSEQKTEVQQQRFDETDALDVEVSPADPLAPLIPATAVDHPGIEAFDEAQVPSRTCNESKEEEEEEEVFDGQVIEFCVAMGGGMRSWGKEKFELSDESAPTPSDHVSSLKGTGARNHAAAAGEFSFRKPHYLPPAQFVICPVTSHTPWLSLDVVLCNFNRNSLISRFSCGVLGAHHHTRNPERSLSGLGGLLATEPIPQ